MTIDILLEIQGDPRTMPLRDLLLKVLRARMWADVPFWIGWIVRRGRQRTLHWSQPLSTPGAEAVSETRKTECLGSGLAVQVTTYDAPLGISGETPNVVELSGFTRISRYDVTDSRYRDAVHHQR